MESASSFACRDANTPTLDVEIECLALCEEVSGGYQLLSKPGSTFGTSREAVRAALIELLGGDRVSPTGADRTFARWVVAGDPSVEASNEENRMLRNQDVATEKLVFDYVEANKASRWFRANKELLEASKKGHLVAEPIEIVTPVIAATREGLQQIEEVYTWLNQYPFFVNDSCGLHVHVAKQRRVSEGVKHTLSLSELQNRALAVLCAEYQFVRLQPRNRYDSKHILLNSTGALDPEDRFVAAALARVMEIKTPADLLDLLTRDPRKLVVNFGPQKAIEDDCGDPDLLLTIEFRSGAATLSTERALAWIEFVSRFFMTILKLERPALLEVLSKCDKNFSAHDLLTHLGLDEFIKNGTLVDYGHSWREYCDLRDYGVAS